MKLNTVHNSVSSSGMNIKVKMKIAANAKSYGVLSSGIYSNIEPTIVRELSSNAYDAHKSVGKADVPFEVQCPTAFDPYFGVKDFGTGLRYFKYNAIVTNEHDGESTIYIEGDVRDQIRNIDVLILNGETTADFVGAVLHDTKKDQTVIRIMGNYEGVDVPVEFDDTLVLYSTYFMSTKEDTNDYVGAFGLGSKTPLAYTDNFLVTNIFNGTKRIYNIMKDEEGEPQIRLMLSEDTDETNGLEVKLAVAPDDYATFKTAIAEQLKYFNPLPKVLNDEVTFPKVEYVGKYFLICENTDRVHNRYGSYAHAAVGNNAYTIRFANNDLFRSGNLVLKFDIGEVMVTTSREALKYEDGTSDLIAERERQALEEYTKYVMDSIDADGMTDYEKAEFLNKNHSVLDLSSVEVQKKVGNPHYSYRANSIDIPVSGWGEYSNLVIKTENVYDDAGELTGTTPVAYDKYNSRSIRALRWSKYGWNKGKTEKLSGLVLLKPTEQVTVFIRDNSFSFLKKIAYYLEENEIQRDSKVLVVDLMDGGDAALKAVKSLVSHCVTFVTLSSITLPKVLNMTATDRYKTPTARLYQIGNDFEGSKYWKEVYTPLTKIEVDNTFIIKTHHGNVVSDEFDYDDQRFLRTYFKSGLPYDQDITILALSVSRFEKALTYGFKPISKLVKKLKKTVTVPVERVNAKALESIMYDVRNNSMFELVNGALGPDKMLEALPRNNPLRKLLRIISAFQARYENQLDATVTNALQDYVQDVPKPSDFVQPSIDKIQELLYTVDSKLILLDRSRSWEFRDDAKKEALVTYLKMVFNTGETP